MSLVLIVVAILSMQGVSQTTRVIAAKFDTATDEVLIPVTIGGHDFWCSADSGFSALIALDRTKAIAAGLSAAPGIPTPDGNAPSTGDSSTVATVVVAGVTFPSRSIILRRFPEEAPDMDCVLGVALLRQFVVEFDHVKPRLILHERGEYRAPEGSAVVPLLFRTNPSVPYVDIQMTLRDGALLPLRVVPDTGTSFYGAVLVGTAIARAESLERVPAVTYSDPQAGRITQIFAARPRAISIGPFTVNDPVVAMLQGNLGGDGSIADGTVGFGVFRRFTVAFDFDGRKMYLTPNERFVEPHLFDASGVGFIRRAGRHVVYAVIPDSVGAAANVHVGDVLLRIDNRDARELTPLQLRILMSADGVERRLLLERDGQMLTLVLSLKARL